MSLETEIKKLTEAVLENTKALLAAAGVGLAAPVTTTVTEPPAAAAPPAPPAPPAAAAPPAPPAPPAAGPAAPPAPPAPPAAPAAPVTLQELNDLAVAKAQTKGDNGACIIALIQKYGGPAAASLNAVPAEQLANFKAELEAL